MFRKTHDMATTVKKLAQQRQVKSQDKLKASQVTQPRQLPTTRTITNAISNSDSESFTSSSLTTTQGDLSGGTIGQVLTKKSDSFYDFIWTNGGTGLASMRWIDLVNGWKTTPVLIATIAGGEVYEYVYESEYGDVTLYRITAGSEPDAFYREFNNPVLSGLVVTRKVLL